MDLSSSISDLPKVGPILSRKLSKLEIKTVGDLFYHVPSRYVDYSLVTTINKIRAGETVTIHAKINSIKNIYSKRGLRMQIGSVEDTTGKLSVIWFNQPFLIKMLYPGHFVSLSGKVGFFNKKICLTSPEYELIDEEDSTTLHTGRLVPIYPETAGLSSKWLRRLELIINNEELKINDYLPKNVLTRRNLVNLKDAIQFVHFPKNIEEAEKGRERLAFDELLKLELQSLLRKSNWQKQKVSAKIKIDHSSINRLIEELPFELTDSQKRAVDEILSDMSKPVPMNRLLEGDVGSGKTVVAAVGMFISFLSGYQSILMAPTQILAAQHYKTLTKLFEKYKVRISLLTSNYKLPTAGRPDIFVGTHSLIHKKVKFDHVAFIVIDEQHRFGVEQRQHLVKKTALPAGRQGTPHVLTMTATPIPRTVALTSYGDLDLSILNEMPIGRQKVTTWVVPEKKRVGAYEWIKKQMINDKCQIFWVCPLIEASDAETLKDVKNVTEEFEKLENIFSGFKLGLLHGRLKPNEKENALSNFKEGKIDMLVTTPVVEVGIDIPNATVMVIEAAERFGLAQLHQLRGRVGRGDKKSYCLLFSNFHSGNAFSRLKAMETTHSGFELAELDLKMRGPGEIFGTAQSGFPELKIASWNNYELIKKAKDVAIEIAKDPSIFRKLTPSLTTS